MGYLEIALAGFIWAATGPLVRGLIEVGFTSWDIVLGRAIFSMTFLGSWLLLRTHVKRVRQRGGKLQNAARPMYATTDGDTSAGSVSAQAAGDNPTGSISASNPINFSRSVSDSSAGQPATGSSDTVSPASIARAAAIADEVPVVGPLDLVVPTSTDIPTFLALGFLAVVLAQVTYFYALSRTSVAVAVTLNYTAPIFVMILSYFVYKEPMTRAKSVSLACAVLGVALTSGFIGTGNLAMNIPGVLAGLMSGLAYGSQTLVYKKVGTRYGPIALNFWTMTLGSIDLAVLLTLLTGRPPEVFAKVASAAPHTWLLLVLIGIGPGMAAFILFADGINKVDATRGSIVAMSEPVAACLLGYLMLDESLTALQIAGIFLVLGSICTVSLSKAPSRPSQKRLGQSLSTRVEE